MTAVSRDASSTRYRVWSIVAMIALLATTITVLAPAAEAQGPPYAGPTTGAVGPAYFGPAPNDVPYCESPTYFDPFPENVAPIGEINVTGAPNASVTTDGITLDFELTSEGDLGGQYPGFFPFTNGAGETLGVPGDQPKGVEMAANDAATIRLSEPLFYSQWVFTDVDRENEGFFVGPDWTDPDAEIAIFGGDANFAFSGNPTQVLFNDADTVGLPSESLGGRVQVDLLGAVTGIQIERDTGSGQSGFAVGGGCEAAGASKVLTSGPTWNGSSYDVTFDLRIRNNLPSGATVAAAVLAAQSRAASNFLTDTPSGISLDSLQLDEPLVDPAFGQIEVVSVTNPGGSLPLNAGFDGVNDVELLGAGASLGAESDQRIELQVRYTPDLAQAEWNDCSVGHTYVNQATVSGSAANVAVADESDDGVNPAPGNDNGAGGVDDPTIVVFPCPPADLDIVKTVVPGPNGVCPDFAGGISGDGPTLTVTDQDFVTYCIGVANPGTSDATSVLVSDPQNPAGDVSLGTIAGGGEASTSYDLQVDRGTPTVNTATVQALGPDATPLGPVSDTAVIAVDLLPAPTLSIVKTVLQGPGALCPAFDDGVQGVGPALSLRDGDIATYCISVRNTGPGDAVGVAITDPQAPAGFDGAVGALAANTDATRSFDISVDQDTPTLNTATVNGDGPYGPVAPDSDDSLILVSRQPNPVVEIVKTVIAGPNGVCGDFASGVIGAGAALPVVFGESVTYCISVRNIGGTDASDVVITDPQAPAGFDGAIGVLASGTEQTLSYDIAVDAATPALNTATVNGTGPNGALPSQSDQAVIDATAVADPALQIVKTVVEGPGGTCPATFAEGVDGLGDALPVLFGETVTYCITVRNDAGSDAFAVLVTDTQAPDGFDGDVGVLAVGQERNLTYDVVVDSSTPMLNTAAVGGSGPNGPVADDSDQAQIDPSPQPDPVLDILKTAVRGPNGQCPDHDNGVLGVGPALAVIYGDTVTFCITVRNDGNSPATSVSVFDLQAPIGFGAIGTMGPISERALAYDVVITQDTPLVNTAQVGGDGPNGALPFDRDQAAIAPTDAPQPSLAIVKTVLAGPGATCPDFAGGVPDIGPALRVFFEETVTYCMTVANSGLADASTVVVTDPQAPDGFTGLIGDLAAGAEATVSFDLVIGSSTPQINTAAVSGEGPDGPVPGDSDSAQISSAQQPLPELAIVKTAVAGPSGTCPAFEDGVVGPGAGLPVMITDVVTYCISVRNIGESPVTDVVINDPQASGEIAVGTLVAGQTFDTTYDLVVDEDTPLINTAVASGIGPEGSLSAEDDARIIATEQLIPSVTLTNTVVSLETTCAESTESVDEFLVGELGETVRWCFEITNTGNTSLADIVFDDLPLGLDSVDVLAAYGGGSSALQPGTSIVFDLVATIPNNGVVSQAQVVATPSDTDGVPLAGLSNVADTNDAAVAEAGITLDKGVAAGDNADCDDAVDTLSVDAGDIVTWCFTATNIGIVALQVAEITDVTLDLELAIAEEQQRLDPGESITVQVSLAADDDVDNVASVDGVPVDDAGDPYPDAPVLTDDDEASVDTLSADLAVTKTVSPASDVLAGSLVVYTLTVENLGPDPAQDVVIIDELPTGLTYESLPDIWSCSAEAADDSNSIAERMTCTRTEALAVDEVVTLTYTARIGVFADPNTAFTNTVTVESSTPDPDTSNNEDSAATRTRPPDSAPIIGVEYPGPFELPVVEEPDEVRELVLTGAASRLMVMISMLLMMAGGFLQVLSRRFRED